MVAWNQVPRYIEAQPGSQNGFAIKKFVGWGAFSFFAARFGSTLINDPSSASSFAAAAYTAAVILWVMAAQAALAIGERKPIWDALSEGQRKLLGMGPLKNQKLLKIAIEPLVGYFRHPYAISQCTPQGQNTVHVLDLSYLVFRGMSLDAFNALYPGRKYLIDLGINGPNRSLLWFQERYNKMGIEFDEVWGWEKRELDPQSFWRYVPSSIYSKLHFMNVAVDLNFDERHPLEVIRNLYKDGDYVALKLAIDSPGFEEIIADRILDDPEILKILGDFYYEMHFGAPYFPYHNIPSNDSIYNMENVMAFFVQLRDKGLRAHYWV
ncbi:hypothetical protein Ndes2526B_g04003 [Nannochloris sp. 'desiccata']